MEGVLKVADKDTFALDIENEQEKASTILISTFKLGRTVVVVVVGTGVVVGQGGPEHSAISSGSPGHCDVGWLCFVNTRYLVRVR